tara:strand:- start:201 stop:896 length:696 start_codon:yes stop_codon:yes gene_type:complete
MSQISSYPYDVVVQDQDAWIGTDANNRQTKQYTASAVATYLNIKGKISIGAQVPYQFTSVVASGVGTMSLLSGGVSSFANLTSLKIHKEDLGTGDTIKFFEYLIGSDIMIAQMNAPSIFGHYKISTYSVDPNNPNLYNIVLNHIGSNGSLTNLYYYDICNFTLASASDKTFVHDQAVPSAIWTITHNLGKFPSVSVVDTQKTIYWGNVEYINSNQLKVTFSAAFAGQAFLN